MARIFRRSVTIGLATALVSLSLGAAPALAGPEGSFVKKVNAARAANGKAPLQVYWDLTDDARAHSKAMMKKGELYHNPDLASVTTGWEALGENVGVGPSVDLLFDAFMDSSGHRKNILGNFNYIGVGVEVESDTKLWVTMVFMLGPDDLLDPPDDPPPATTTTTTAAPTTTTTTAAPTTTTTAAAPTTTTTTAPSPREPVAVYDPGEEELAVLSSDWVPPAFFRLLGRVGR